MNCISLALLRVAVILPTLILLTSGLIFLSGHWLVGQPVGPQVAAIGALVLLGLASLATAAAGSSWRSVLAVSYLWGLSCGLGLLLLGGDARTVLAWSALLAAALFSAAIGTLIEVTPVMGPGQAMPVLSPARSTSCGHGWPVAGIGLLGRLSLLLPLWVASFATFRGEERTTLIGWPEGAPDPNTHTRCYHHGLVLPWQECPYSWIPAHGDVGGQWVESSPSPGRLIGHATFQLFVPGAVLLPWYWKGPWHQTPRSLS